MLYTYASIISNNKMKQSTPLISLILLLPFVHGAEEELSTKAPIQSGRAIFGKMGPTIITQISNAFNITLEGSDLSESIAQSFVHDVEPWINKICSAKASAEWKYVSNLTPENEAASLQATLDYTEFHRYKYWPNFNKFKWQTFKDPLLKRQFRLESLLGASVLDQKELKRYTELRTNMTKIYSTAKVCDYKDKTKCDIALDPTITSLFATSRDPEELEYYWKEWRDATGKKMPGMYQEFVNISNQVAKMNGYHDIGELWRRPYEDPLMPLEMWTLWGQLRPLYEQIHAYVRRRLHNKYGDKWINLRGTIPAHLLGNVWAQNWANLGDILAPFKDSSDVANMDVTEAMKAGNYTVIGMVHMSDEFFKSLGLIPMNEAFWENSIFERPAPPRQIVCHPEAYDLCDGKSFFIKMCAEVNMRDFITVHHEMGHIQYYMQYKDQLNTFREGSNPAFHEAIGDTIAMSVSSPGHLESLGLLKGYKDNDQNRINFLLSQALKLFVDLPWSLMLEQWRWDVFSGKVDASEYNCHWWTLRSKMQGVKPPKTRTWEDFDPGAKYHIPNSTPYARYFVARLLTYQLHEALCKEAGQFGKETSKPLYMCSIHGSKSAGGKLQEMLKLGSKLPWPQALAKVTGKNKLDPNSVLSYYSPLVKWLEEENRKNGDEPGWEEDPLESLCTPKVPYP